MTRASRLLAAAVALAAVGGPIVGCQMRRSVVRIVDGRRVEGRNIRAEAYAAYLEAVWLETQGKLDDAALAYERALADDSDSVELWTHLGSVRCRKSTSLPSKGMPGPAHRNDPSWTAFDHAAALDAEYEPLWTERAACHLRHNELGQAVEAAEHAVSLDPDAIEPVVALTAALERAGRTDDARRWLDGLVARTPTIETYETMASFASRTRDPVRARLASDELRRVRGPSRRVEPTMPRSRRDELSELDAALLAEDGARARDLARALQLTRATVVLRTVALGRAARGYEQAKILVDADPADTDARIAMAYAGDLLRNDAIVEAAFRDLPDGLRLPSPLGALLLEKLLTRRTTAADLHLLPAGAIGGAPPSDSRTSPPEDSDPLLERVRNWK